MLESRSCMLERREETQPWRARWEFGSMSFSLRLRMSEELFTPCVHKRGKATGMSIPSSSHGCSIRRRRAPRRPTTISPELHPRQALRLSRSFTHLRRREPTQTSPDSTSNDLTQPPNRPSTRTCNPPSQRWRKAPCWARSSRRLSVRFAPRCHFGMRRGWDSPGS